MAFKLNRSSKEPISEINVTPFVDVMLVLLIIFMVTAPLLMQGVKVELPSAPSAPLDKNSKAPLIVSIKSDGTFYIDLRNGRNKKETSRESACEVHADGCSAEPNRFK